MIYINKDYSNQSIHLGVIVRCNKGNRIGVLCGFRKPPYNGKEQIYENKLYYFEKEVEQELAMYTLVSYLSFDYNGFTAKAEYVYPVSSLIIHNDKRGKSRADMRYHDDETWKLINEGIPFFDYAPSREYCIYYPIIKDNECTIWRGLFGCGIYMNKEAIIYEMYKELAALESKSWPTLDEVTETLTVFKNHIESINSYDIIDTFEIKKSGQYISRPGKDDQYFEDLYQNFPNDDKFLSYLLPTKHENIFFDDNAYRSDGYWEGEILLEEETINTRNKAKAEYSKEKHLAFLVNDYYLEIAKNKERAGFLKNKMKAEFDIENALKTVSGFHGNLTERVLELISVYNESTLVGPLWTEKS